VTLVLEPGNGAIGSGGTLGLKGSRFDWEAKWVHVFNSLSGRTRTCPRHPTPGSLMKGGYEEAEKQPETIPTTTGVTNENEKKLVDVALGNLALVLIEPTFADWIQLGAMPDRQTCFDRGGDRGHCRTLKHALYRWSYKYLNYYSTCVMCTILLIPCVRCS
jgi:hypothetical protein